MNLVCTSRPIAGGSGTAQLALPQKRQRACTFEYSQLANGSLYVDCQPSAKAYELFQRGHECSLKGATRDGLKVSATHLRPIRISGSPGKEVVTYRCGQLKEKASVPVGGTKTFTFMLVNLSLLRRLQVKWRNMVIDISPDSGHLQVIERLKAEQGCDITCIASVTTQALQKDKLVIREVDRICSLLSLARGCRVTWVNCEVRASRHQLLRRFYRDAITKPFSSSSELIPSNPPGDTQVFLEQAFERYQAGDRKYGIGKVIEVLTDAKIQTDFLELRSLKATVSMECLVGRHVINSRREFIIPQETFDANLKEVRAAVQSALAKCSAIPDSRVGDMANHVQALNRYSFSSNLSSLCRELGIPINSKARRRFVSVRNRLVHDASYNPEDLGDEWDQHTHILAVVSKTLLGILQYDGFFLDPTIAGGWAGTSNPARKRFKLTQNTSLRS